MSTRKALTRSDLLACAVGFLGLTAGGIFFTLVAIPTGGPVLCTFKRLTGIGCPGCGLTRSISAMMHFRIAEALHWHLFGPPVVVVVLLMWILLGLSLVTRKAYYPDANSRWLNLSVLSAGGILVVYWIVRLAMNAVP